MAPNVQMGNCLLMRCRIGGYPGPLIKADWGDRIEVRVTNRLKTNGSVPFIHLYYLPLRLTSF